MWSTCDDKALLIAYQGAYANSKLKKWIHVVTEFHKLTPGRHTSMTSETARLKIRSLEQKYSRLKKHNDTSGNDPKLIPEAMEDAFGAKHAAVFSTLDSVGTSKGVWLEFASVYCH